MALVIWAAGDAHAQSPQAIDGARLVEVRLEPEAPSLALAFQLHVRLRVRPTAVAFLPDTLPPTDGVHSVGPGEWTEVAAPGDSVEIRMTYPLIGFQEGPAELPPIELWLRTSGDEMGSEGAARSAGEAAAAAATEVDRRVLRTGFVDMGPFVPMLDENVVLEPRPAADVLGGVWSIWRLLATVLTLLGLALAVVMLVPRWWASIGAPMLARLRGRSPRQEALRELERIRSEGWHKDGRTDDFYAASTDVLRHFAERIEPESRMALTSTELVSKLEERWGAGGIETLVSTVELAERVKFGDEQPEAEAAERDWSTIRNWIRRAPEG
jgi:hypothetical protein